MRSLIPLALLLTTGCANVEAGEHQVRPPSAIDESKIVDLTHPFNEHTVYWPTAQSFRLERVAFGRNETGNWYASNNYAASEHGGTHLDAPIHFAESRPTIDRVPVTQLIGPARVIDIRDRCAKDRDYLLAPEDIRRYEDRHGRIQPGDLVLIHTGFGRFYPDKKKYLGSDLPGEVSDLHFPGIGAPAAELLVERRIDLVGLDTASLDHGPSADFPAHRILNGAGICGLENVANLEKLPPCDATLMALPMKIENGSGAPCRVIAILP